MNFLWKFIDPEFYEFRIKNRRDTGVIGVNLENRESIAQKLITNLIGDGA